MVVLIHICTQLQEHSQPLIFIFLLRTFVWTLISWLNRIRMFPIPIILKISVSLLDSLPRWNFSRADWVQFDQLCKEKFRLDTN